MDLITQLKAKLAEFMDQIVAIQARADEESRDLTADESQQIDGLFTKFDNTKLDIERRERIEAQRIIVDNVGPGRQTQPAAPSMQARNTDPAGVVRVEGGEPAGATRGSGGFRNFGEFALGVRQACVPGGAIDPRLQAPTTTANEGAGADGGFAVPPDFRSEIQSRIDGEESLMSRTDQLTTSSNAITLPKDEEEPWLTGGARAFWTGEAAEIVQSRPQLLEHTTQLFKLAALVPVTEELLEDAPAMDRFLRRKTPEVMVSEINNALVNGNGTTQPQGLMNAGSLITVAGEVGQAADTFNYENVINMWSRLHAKWRRNAVWIMNQDVEPQLLNMRFVIQNVAGTENVGGQAVYLPAGSLANQPFDTLLGRPILFEESSPTLGDVGDVILTDLNQYMSVTKTQGIRQDVSMHLFFEYDTMAFRFIIRVGGESWLSGVINPRNGTVTRSNIVRIAAR